MWMTRAPGANASSLPVTRSSKRAPQAISRSHLFIAQLAAREPCMPGRPMHCGWLSGTTPFAISVVTTGSWAASARAIRSAGSQLIAPPPTYRVGRSAARIASAAVMIWRGWPCREGL